MLGEEMEERSVQQKQRIQGLEGLQPSKVEFRADEVHTYIQAKYL